MFLFHQRNKTIICKAVLNSVGDVKTIVSEIKSYVLFVNVCVDEAVTGLKVDTSF